MAVRVELVVAAFPVLYGCGQASTPVERQEKQGGMEQAQGSGHNQQDQGQNKGQDQGQGQNQAQQDQHQQQQQPAQQQGGGQQANSGGDKGVIFRVTATPGLKFEGSIGTMDISRSVQGTTPQDYPLKIPGGRFFSTDYVSGSAWKMAGGGQKKLTVQIVVDGKVAKQASTSARYGSAQVKWSASE